MAKSTTTESPITTIGAILRVSEDPSADMARYFKGASVSDQQEIVRFISDSSATLLGLDSRLTVQVALMDASEDAGHRALKCKAGTRTACAHIARFNRYGIGINVLESIERALAA